ncbi:phosphomevalonate kinase [Malassezia sp. CBS 17886]|nr:phosphomevalonate kinase [Malassezia sp. CBS 17886]
MPTTVSAPGKVLLCGGYLVLDPAYTGIVLATDARFYTHVKSAPGEADAPRIRVRSPQFLDAEWVYAVEVPWDASMDAVHVTERLRLRQTAYVRRRGPAYSRDGTAARNPFVALALLYTLQVSMEACGVDAVRRRLGSGMDIVIAGDNDFYSHRAKGVAPTFEQLCALPPFSTLGCTLGDVHKTGLGSSAAMTTSLVAAVLLHLGSTSAAPAVAGAATDEDGTAARGAPAGAHAGCAAEPCLSTWSLSLTHNVAQLAHCAAQGKIGSGFDVSAAVWGSQVYRRFNADVLKGLRLPMALLSVLSPANREWQPALSGGAAAAVPTAAEGLAELQREQEQDQAQEQAAAADDRRPAALTLPPGIRMCLADVDAGSNTRTLVGRVSDWVRAKPEWAAQLYAVVAASNQALGDSLLALHVAYAKDAVAYARVLAALGTVPFTQWDSYRKEAPSATADALVDARNALRSIRAGMRELGTRAAAPVEPPEMTRLLDASIRSADGVLGGGVPGAGGYDALFLLFLDPRSLEQPDARMQVPEAVRTLWHAWTELSVGPLTCGAEGRSAAAPSIVRGPHTPVDDGSALGAVLRALAPAHAGVRVVDAASVHGLAAMVAD